MIEVKEPKKEIPLIGTIKAVVSVGKHAFQKPEGNIRMCNGE